MIPRRIVAFEADDVGDWVAHLDCGHRRHVRHDPPFRTAPWVLDERGRAARIGAQLECAPCDRAEPPEDLVSVRTTDTWDELSMPSPLRRAHRLAPGTWGCLHVEAGQVRFRAATEPAIDVLVDAGASQAIPPEVPHEVEPVGAVRFAVEFLRPPG